MALSIIKLRKVLAKSVNIWKSYKQEGGCPVYFVCLATTLLKVEKCTIQFTKYSPIKNIIDNKAFLIYLLKIPPHLINVTTVPCNLSLITALLCDCRSFSDINVSQGSVATHTRCGGDFNFAACCKFTGESDSEKNYTDRMRINDIFLQ